MNREELRSRFILDESALRADIEALTTKALKYCHLDASGRVHIKNSRLSGAVRVKLALTAKLLGSELDPSFSSDMTVEEAADATALPSNQARARLADAVRERFAKSVGRGVFRAYSHQVGSFLDALDAGGIQ